MTLRKSAMSILAKDLSRRMPALLMRMSIRPHFSMTVDTMASTAASSVMSLPSTIASPPAAVISSTTCCASDGDPPSPRTSPPRSLTTTLAPRSASARAYARPRPPAAPVTIATRSVNSMVLVNWGLLYRG